LFSSEWKYALRARFSFEVIAINDGSHDNTAEVLDKLTGEIPRLRVVHLAKNSGKAIALSTGASLARYELLVCIDGDALLDPHALHWIATAFLVSGVGAVAGNPRIRNRTSLPAAFRWENSHRSLDSSAAPRPPTDACLL
jgi:biofilm PGA synthesis N-glycosyltransferase PgaC